MEHIDQVNYLENRITQLEKENLLQEKVDFPTKKLYGRKGQMSLFDEAETPADPAPVPYRTTHFPVF